MASDGIRPVVVERRGFTLIECLLAVAVVLVGFFAVAQINPMSYRASAVTKNHLVALQFGQNVVNIIQSRAYGTAVTDLVNSTYQMNGEQVEGATVTQKFTVQSIQFAAGGATADATKVSDNVTVTIAWTEGTGPGSTPIDKTVQVTSAVTREP
jgi:prepilin-type N-terminal cleavage/methylation domain-containing protein